MEEIRTDNTETLKNALERIVELEEKIDKITEMRLRNEVKNGIQMIQYQVVTLMTTNGQAPFVTVFMYLNEAKNDREKKDLALIIEETLKQRIIGVKNDEIFDIDIFEGLQMEPTPKDDLVQLAKILSF